MIRGNRRVPDIALQRRLVRRLIIFDLRYTIYAACLNYEGFVNRKSHIVNNSQSLVTSAATNHQAVLRWEKMRETNTEASNGLTI